MTTTGFTMRFKFIQMIKPEILIIEEASEIDEWNLAALLQPYIKHIIQIGDYKQLQPIQTNSKFCNSHNLNISQFERMLSKLKFKSKSNLQYQRRMISKLSVFPKCVYEEEGEFQDDKEFNQMLKQRQKLKKEILFFNHTFKESKTENIPSYVNQFEAFLCIHLAIRMCQQFEIQKSSITILCMYRSQVKRIDELQNEYKYELGDQERFEIKTVDEFQGKENDYIILSCVRCNDQYQLGFIKQKTRINVAFSRARLGLYVIGAFWMYESELQLWKKIISKANKQEAIINDQKKIFDFIKGINEDIQFFKEKYENKCVINPNHPSHIGECEEENILSSLNDDNQNHNELNNEVENEKQIQKSDQTKKIQQLIRKKQRLKRESQQYDINENIASSQIKTENMNIINDGQKELMTHDDQIINQNDINEDNNQNNEENNLNINDNQDNQKIRRKYEGRKKKFLDQNDEDEIIVDFQNQDNQTKRRKYQGRNQQQQNEIFIESDQMIKEQKQKINNQTKAIQLQKSYLTNESQTEEYKNDEQISNNQKLQLPMNSSISSQDKQSNNQSNYKSDIPNQNQYNQNITNSDQNKSIIKTSNDDLLIKYNLLKSSQQENIQQDSSINSNKPNQIYSIIKYENILPKDFSSFESTKECNNNQETVSNSEDSDSISHEKEFIKLKDLIKSLDEIKDLNDIKQQLIKIEDKLIKFFKQYAFLEDQFIIDRLENCLSYVTYFGLDNYQSLNNQIQLNFILDKSIPYIESLTQTIRNIIQQQLDITPQVFNNKQISDPKLQNPSNQTTNDDYINLFISIFFEKNLQFRQKLSFLLRQRGLLQDFEWIILNLSLNQIKYINQKQMDFRIEYIGGINSPVKQFGYRVIKQNKNTGIKDVELFFNVYDNNQCSYQWVQSSIFQKINKQFYSGEIIFLSKEDRDKWRGQKIDITQKNEQIFNLLSLSMQIFFVVEPTDFDSQLESDEMTSFDFKEEDQFRSKSLNSIYLANLLKIK